jgi:hypothetical protein
MKIPNRPSALGSQLGENHARFADQEEAKFAAALGFIPVRCKSCAFRAGTVPNGSSTTQMDALKCVMEKLPFYCHEGEHGEESICAGYILMTADRTNKIECPWPYSDDAQTGELLTAEVIKP